MKLNRINPVRALNLEYRTHKTNIKKVNDFIAELKKCLVTVKEADAVNEKEEFMKSPIKEFLQNTFYKDNLVNTKGDIDLAIYTGKDLYRFE